MKAVFDVEVLERSVALFSCPETRPTQPTSGSYSSLELLLWLVHQEHFEVVPLPEGRHAQKSLAYAPHARPEEKFIAAKPDIQMPRSYLLALLFAGEMGLQEVPVGRSETHYRKLLKALQPPAEAARRARGRARHFPL